MSKINAMVYCRGDKLLVYNSKTNKPIKYGVIRGGKTDLQFNKGEYVITWGRFEKDSNNPLLNHLSSTNYHELFSAPFLLHILFWCFSFIFSFHFWIV